jgi:outer membrane protein TolC
VDQAEESQRIIHNRYKAGVTTIVEVLDADTALLSAQLAALQARYDHNLAQVELDFALGRLKS